MMKPLRGSPHRALLLMLGLIFLLSVAVVLYCAQSYWKADIAYEALQEALPAQNVFSAPETSLDTHAPQLPSPIMTHLPASVLQTLKMQNEHFAFHLFCPDTAINYPVVQGEDNAYYLGHLFGGEENAAGCLFVDYLCDQDFSSDNTIVYGHNMKNGSMFATLLAYKDETFYKAHPTMQLQTADAVYLIELIAGYSPADDFMPGRLTLPMMTHFMRSSMRHKPPPPFKATSLSPRRIPLLPSPRAAMKPQMHAMSCWCALFRQQAEAVLT